MKDQKKSQKKSAKKSPAQPKFKALGGGGGDMEKGGTTPPGGPKPKKKKASASPKKPKPGQGAKKPVGPGGNGQKGKTTVPAFKALGDTGGDSQKEKTSPPGFTALGDTGGDSQKEKTSPPGRGIIGIGGTGANGQKGGTTVPRDEADQEKRDQNRQGILAHAERVKGSVYVSRDDIIGILDRKLGGLWKKGVPQFAFIGDTDYYCPPLDEVAGMLQHSNRNKKYQAEIFDCDDFSYELKGDFTHRAFENGKNRPFGFALGIVWLDKPFPHAMNWVISWGNGQRDQRTLYFVEPQTGEIFDIDAAGVLREIHFEDEPTEGRRYRRYEIIHGAVRGDPHRDIYLTMI